MDPIAIARYGLTAASNQFEVAATRIARQPADETIDLGQEIVGLIQAKTAYAANLTVIRFAQDMWDSLLRLQTSR